jgi:CBS domain containing-hemolysin-like protein
MSEQRKKRYEDSVWYIFRETMEVRLAIICSVSFIVLFMLGLFTIVIGSAVIPVVIHIEFEIAIALWLIGAAFVLYWLFVVWLFARTAKTAIRIRSERINMPVELVLDEEDENR